MKHGNKINFIFICLIFLYTSSLAEDTITTTPLINLDKIKPSFEEFNDEKDLPTTTRRK